VASAGKIFVPSFIEIRLVVRMFSKDKLTVIAFIFSSKESTTKWGPTVQIQCSAHKQHECLIFGLDHKYMESGLCFSSANYRSTPMFLSEPEPTLKQKSA
jgi:hypothetical protein